MTLMNKNAARQKRHTRVRKRVEGTSERPRMNVYRSTNNIYVQVIEPNVMRAVNSHANAALDGWTPPIEGLGFKGATSNDCVRRRKVLSQFGKVFGRRCCK